MKVGAFQPLPPLARSRVPRSPMRREPVARKVVALSNSLLLSWRALAEKLQPSSVRARYSTAAPVVDIS